MTIYNYLVAILPLVGIGIMVAVILRIPIDSPERRKRLHPDE